MAAINPDPAATRVVIYCRVSDDRRSGRSVSQQETELRADCADHGWTVVDVVTDDDVGASPYSRGDRPGWKRVLAMAEAGDVDVIATWESSRGQRDLEVYVLLRRLCVDTGVKWFYGGRLYDLTRWRDRRDTGRDAVDDEASSGQTSERGRRDARAAALAGRPHGRTLYGYRRLYEPTPRGPRLVGQEPAETPVPGPPAVVAVLLSVLGGWTEPYETPAEADVVDRIFGRYLAGEGLGAIAAGLNTDVIPAPGARGGWDATTVARVLDNPSYAGRRTHHGTRVAEGGWPAIVDPVTFDRAQARRRGRRGTRQAPTARLLSGVARCGVCGSRCGVEPKGDRRVYQCRSSAGCVAREMTRLDDWVTFALLERLRRDDVHLDVPGPDPRVAEAEATVARLRGRLADATDEFLAERISAATLARIEAGLVPRIADAERAARRAHLPLDLPDLPADPAAVPAWWDAQSPERRRVVVGAFIVSVIIRRLGRGRHVYDDAEFTDIEWRR